MASEQETQQAIEKRAYELWQSNGSQHGRDQEFWMAAEKEIKGSSSQEVIIIAPRFDSERTPVNMNESENKPIKKQSKRASKKAKTVDAGLE
jgi:3-deoxy-D-manno-octulosonic-acid transferase